MAKQVITTRHPVTVHSSRGIKAGPFIFTGGTLGHQDRDTGEPIKGIEAQTRRCLENVKEVMEAAGASMSDVVSTRFYLRNAADFRIINEVCKIYFPKDPPARATLVCDLLFPEALVEVEAIAYTEK